MIGIPLGWAYSNFGEWVLHRYVLHGLGRHRQSFWSFHWHEHHQKSRRHDMVDDQYMQSLWTWSAKTKELLALAVLGLAHVPLFPVAPFFVGTVWACTANYYRVHRRAHLDPAWARTHLPWHYDHHMGKDQNANWCVTHPLFDHLLGTRREFLGVQPAGPRTAGPVPVAASPREAAGASVA